MHLGEANASFFVDLLLMMHNRVIPRQLQETEIKVSVRIVDQRCISSSNKFSDTTSRFFSSIVQDGGPVAHKSPANSSLTLQNLG